MFLLLPEADYIAFSEGHSMIQSCGNSVWDKEGQMEMDELRDYCSLSAH